jgi:membrane glycosyltransferase
MPRAVSLAMHFNSGTAAGFGGKDKLVWSMFLETVFSLLFSPIQMIIVSHYIWMWMRRRSVTWGAQTRNDAPLEWQTCFKAFGWVSLVGLVSLLFIAVQLSQLPGMTDSAIQAFSHGQLRPHDFVVWLLPVLIGFTLSPLLVKSTSHRLRQTERRKLFVTPEEIDPPAVLRDVIHWEEFFRSRLPRHQSLPSALEHALVDVQFYVFHRSMTRYRPALARILLPKIFDRLDLSEKELSMALTERRCFDMLHAQACGW